MSERVNIKNSDYIGAIKLNGKWRFFHEPLSMWILDYSSYDDEYIPSQGEWRENLMKVDESNSEQYVEAMQNEELLPSQIPYIMKPSFSEQALLTFVVNFDDKLFVNGWHDNIAIEEYAPQDWTAIEDDPYTYIPAELRALWNK